MSQRDSGYERKERDLYETPEWVTEALHPHLPDYALQRIWECAAGSGKMADVISRWGAGWFASDIEPLGSGIEQGDFFRWASPPHHSTSIVTNPPYDLGTQFCEHALRVMESAEGLVAMLMRTDFDHAKSRAHLFRDCPAFAKKVVLTKRIMWFEPEPGAKGKSPSFNHAWFIWDWRNDGPPTLAYGP